MTAQAEIILDGIFRNCIFSFQLFWRNDAGKILSFEGIATKIFKLQELADRFPLTFIGPGDYRVGQLATL